MALLDGRVVSAWGLGACSAPCEPQASACIGPALALAVQAAFALGGAFFRVAALVLDFDAALFLGFLADGRGGFFALSTYRTSGAQQCDGQTGTQQCSAQAAAAFGQARGGRVVHGFGAGFVAAARAGTAAGSESKKESEKEVLV